MTYRCGATQDRTVNLIDPAGLMVKRIEPLRTHAWEVELAAHGIDSASLNASSVQLEATCADLNVLDVAGELFDADVKAVASSRSKADSGLLTVDGWSQTALVTGIEPSYDPPGPAKYTLTVALLDGLWRKRDDVQHFWSDALQPGLDLDYPHDYMPTTRNASVVNSAVSAMPFEMVIYGPVSEPSITMGGNTYELHMDIPSGAYVTINSVEGQRSIVMTAENGDLTNVFAKGERGTGMGSGSYIFEPLPSGEHQVQWKGFGFDLTVIRERSVPAWLT
ncbi:hypothetical protein [Bifidobacterium pseudocatenulatum]|uniref:hypothetical protein n=1 Tax=Bifidobacterium pseudocatenulatum TaxID=28026 RepID=UPI000E51BF4B|nr:hypothetical protein [Bifidobacterium pseudocatenulatum]MCB4866252.1 hypothetical protein [Bifidobacterium pseudocatenulatum]RHI81587.1 hypothetical protein DW154_04610 [Bifidobacterium pseudocatenulatum]RHI90804.1 hypothetical protein DW149_02805 [Bifidobacterium pseudocatenulatum]UWI10366.1 MAG: tail protein [Bacteriophage sp.]